LNSKSPKKHCLSVSIIASNEEQNLARCLESIRGIDTQVALVHNDCHDKTVEIAQRFDAKCYEVKWHGHRDQKNIALEKTTNEWILCLDADEALSLELKESIVSFLSSKKICEFDGGRFNRKSYCLGKWIRHGDWYPDKKIRLVRRGKGKWTGSQEHDKLTVNGKVKHLKGDLLHFSYPTLNSFLEKTIYFSDIFAQRSLKKKRSLYTCNIVLRSMWRFFRAYILRFGFLDGFPGLFIAVANAYSTFFRHSKVYEIKIKKKLKK
jgi:glycosyltransferase involved in cell wall biosynthesis